MRRDLGITRDRTSSYTGTIRCPTCRGDMVTKFDAIGRTYERCPACQRVAPPHHHAPDEVLIPQTLVRAVSALPTVRAGQLRCQRCAQGVEGRARFCARCRPRVQSRGRPCTICARVEYPLRHGRCNQCRMHLRHHGGERPAGHVYTRGTKRVYAERVCTTCGRMFLPAGANAKRCEDCR